MGLIDGDSERPVIWLFGDSHTNGYAPKLEALAGEYWDIRNFGFNGSNVEQWLTGVNHDGSEIPFGAQKTLDENPVRPDAMHIMFGVNDHNMWMASNNDEESVHAPLNQGVRLLELAQMLLNAGCRGIQLGRTGIFREFPPEDEPYQRTDAWYLGSVNSYCSTSDCVASNGPLPRVNCHRTQVTDYQWSDFDPEYRNTQSPLWQILAIVHHNDQGTQRIAEIVERGLDKRLEEQGVFWPQQPSAA